MIELTIEQYCKKEKISRAGYYKRRNKGYIKQDRFGRNTLNQITIKMIEPEEGKHFIDKVPRKIPVDGQSVLVTLENQVVTGAIYNHGLSLDIQKRFSPIGVKVDNKCDYKDNCYSFPIFDSKIVSWSPLDE